MPIRNVLFDLDQTLIDFMKMKRESCRSALDAMIAVGLKVDREQGFDKLMETYLRVGIESNTAFEEFLKDLTGAVDRDILDAGIKGYIKAKPYYVKPYPYVLETLKFLKMNGIRLGLVTDAPREKAMYRLDTMGITKSFDVIVTYTESKAKKPSKIPFELAMKMMDIEAADTLFVGDNLERDIEGARRLGMRALHIRRSEDLKKIKKLIKKNLLAITIYVQI